MPTLVDLTQPDRLYILPVGGCGEFGMNMTIFRINRQNYLVDCGVKFPDAYMLGVQAVLPNMSSILAENETIAAYLITHGHEDHIGALPIVWPRYPAPIYASRWTQELINLRFAKYGMDIPKIEVVASNEIVSFADLSVHYLPVNHSIPMPHALFIESKKTSVFHTGDFKFDQDPQIEQPIDQKALKGICKRGVDVLMCDSTNAGKAGMCQSEAVVLKSLQKACEPLKGQIVFTTFSSNLARIITVLKVAKATSRRVLVAGHGMSTTLALGAKLSYPIPENVLIEEAGFLNLAPEKKFVLASGCQGEWKAALARIAADQHKTVKLKHGDTVIFSSRHIPGNEKAIYKIIDELKSRGAQIITPVQCPGLHVSGHGFQGDIALITQLLKPKHFLPIHGSYSQLQANLDHALWGRVDSQLILNGEISSLPDIEIINEGNLATSLSFVDSPRGVVITKEGLRERLRIGENGLLVISGVARRDGRPWAEEPEFDFFGVGFPEHISREKWIESMTSQIKRVVGSSSGNKGLGDVIEEVRVLLRRNLFNMLGKKPVVLCKLFIT